MSKKMHCAEFDDFFLYNWYVWRKIRIDMNAFEVNFDGLVGPSHNYAGLSTGNIASTVNVGEVSSPKKAAKQGLAKAKSLHDLGLKQGILAPHARPDFRTLRRIGFTGSESDIIEKVAKRTPELLAACYSASAMWTANAATISPSSDTENGKVHITPANLNNKFHRSIEPNLTGDILKATLRDDQYFEHHLHLPEGNHFGDEGAANHTRFCRNYGDAGVEFFVFGKYGFRNDMPSPSKYPARQTYEASRAVARLHGLEENRVVFAQQNPEVIDQGVFHNDVISVGNQNVYFYHEQALLHSDQVIGELNQKFGTGLHCIKVPTSKVAVSDAVSSYLFNSQLVEIGNGKMSIVVPSECEENSAVWNYLQELITLGTPIQKINVYNVKESMKNGGGPACLRLRVVLNENELAGVNQKTILDNNLFNELNTWVDKNYRDELAPDDLRDPKLVTEIRTALDELTKIMDLGSIYDFQK